MNDAVKGFLLGPDRFPTEVLELPGVRVEVASAQTVLVMLVLSSMGVLASRGDDDRPGAV